MVLVRALSAGGTRGCRGGDMCGADGWMKLHTRPKTKSFLFSFFWGPPSHSEALGLFRVCALGRKATLALVGWGCLVRPRFRAAKGIQPPAW